MGRKAISGVPKSERPLRIRLTDEERTILDVAANNAGDKTSSWARSVLLAAAAKAQPKPKGKAKP